MKVLVATDGSEQATKAVKRALELAEKEGAKVTLISVAYYSMDGFDDMPLKIQEKLQAEANEALAKGKSLFDKKGIDVETEMQAGLVPANNIIRKAKEGKFDLILIGSTGLSGLQRIMMGSTAVKIAMYAPCSVSIIR